MTKKQNIFLKGSIAFAVMFSITPVSHAMHIMEGYLPMMFCVSWGMVSLPFLAAGFFSIKRTLQQNKRALTLLAMSGAFVFVVSSLKIPSVTGSCSHMTGTGLGAILFGPPAAGVLGLVVLVFQAILLAHGGITTLGANTFSMAIAGPLISYGIYNICRAGKVNRKIAVFFAAFMGDFSTYCVTSLQLALAYPSEAGGIGASFLKFLGVFAPTQLPLAVMEGFLTVIVVITLESYARPELKALGFLKEAE